MPLFALPRSVFVTFLHDEFQAPHHFFDYARLLARERLQRKSVSPAAVSPHHHSLFSQEFRCKREPTRAKGVILALIDRR